MKKLMLKQVCLRNLRLCSAIAFSACFHLIVFKFFLSSFSSVFNANFSDISSF